MTWRKDLGNQIRVARVAKNMSQNDLSKLTSVTREQISNIENGKSSPAVNIVTEIATALSVELEIAGCKISAATPRIGNRPVIAPAQQMSFGFDTEHKFGAASIRITGDDEQSIVLSVTLSQRRVA